MQTQLLDRLDRWAGLARDTRPAQLVRFDDLWPYPRCDHGAVQGDCRDPRCLYFGEDAAKDGEAAVTIPTTTTKGNASHE
jgi:hypothetical protein